MTLKGQKNHYNVKLLRGYGISISLKDNKIHLKNGADILTGKSETESWFITQLPYEKIVISGKCYYNRKSILRLMVKILTDDWYKYCFPNLVKEEKWRKLISNDLRPTGNTVLQNIYYVNGLWNEFERAKNFVTQYKKNLMMVKTQKIHTSDLSIMTLKGN